MKRVALNYNEYDVRGNGTYEECIEESLQTPCYTTYSELMVQQGGTFNLAVELSAGRSLQYGSQCPQC